VFVHIAGFLIDGVVHLSASVIIGKKRPMASNYRDSSEAIQDFLGGVPAGMPDLGEPLSEDREDPLLDRERINLDDEWDE
jgi:hypothetical protein